MERNQKEIRKERVIPTREIRSSAADSSHTLDGCPNPPQLKVSGVCPQLRKSINNFSLSVPQSPRLSVKSIRLHVSLVPVYSVLRTPYATCAILVSLPHRPGLGTPQLIPLSHPICLLSIHTGICFLLCHHLRRWGQSNHYKIKQRIHVHVLFRRRGCPPAACHPLGEP